MSWLSIAEELSKEGDLLTNQERERIEGRGRHYYDHFSSFLRERQAELLAVVGDLTETFAPYDGGCIMGCIGRGGDGIRRPARD